jgi:hypothetical protein
MENIKLTNDAISIIFNALNDAKEEKLNWETFVKNLYRDFPKEIADHVCFLVYNYLFE